MLQGKKGQLIIYSRRWGLNSMDRHWCESVIALRLRQRPNRVHLDGMTPAGAQLLLMAPAAFIGHWLNRNSTGCDKNIKVIHSGGILDCLNRVVTQTSGCQKN